MAAPNHGVVGIATPDRGEALVAETLSKRYGSISPFGRTADGSGGVEALRDVSFSVREGETLGLLGPNGAGKTTLLKIITTLIYPSAGQVRLHGIDVTREPARARRMMGLVTCDERSFYGRLSGRQNLGFFGALYGLTGPQARERGDELLGTLGLTAAADQPYQSYSSGMKQKLAIARGLLGDARVVFYDEPTRSLDPVSAQSIRRWIHERRRTSPRQTHVIATNQLSEAEQLCDRVLILSRGRILTQGTVSEIRERYRARADHEIHRVTYRGPRLNDSLTPDPTAGLLEIRSDEESELGGVLRVCTVRDSGGLSRVLEAILRAGGTVLRCEAAGISFDEVFCALVLGDQPGVDATGRPAPP